MNRLYWWYRGAPANRVGGAWWYKDFLDLEELEKSLATIQPFLEAYAVSENCVELDPMNVKPQPGDDVVRVPGP